MYSRCNKLKSAREKTSLKHEYDDEGISQSRAVMRLSDSMNSFTNALSIGFVDMLSIDSVDTLSIDSVDTLSIVLSTKTDVVWH